MRPNWTILRMYFSLELRSCGVIKLVKIVGKAPTDTGNDGPSPAGGQLGYARRSVALRQMVVNQGLQPGKKLLVGDFIGNSLSFGFQLRSWSAVFLPGRRVYEDAALVAKLGAPRAARVPRALDALQSVL